MTRLSGTAILLARGARLQQMDAASVAASMRPPQHRPAAVLLVLALLIPLTTAAPTASALELAHFDADAVLASTSRTSGQSIRWHQVARRTLTAHARPAYMHRYRCGRYCRYA